MKVSLIFLTFGNLLVGTFADSSPFQEFCTDNVHSSKSLVMTRDNFLSKDGLSAFNKEAKHLENSTDPTRNWKKRIDLVDPLKYCLVKGITQLARVVPPGTESLNGLNKFQNLPSDISVDKDGVVKFTSYINNLNPTKYPALYASLEHVVSLSLPLFEEILQNILQNEKLKLRNRNLQVVIAMRNMVVGKQEIHNGTRWHSEGLIEDGMVALAVFYRDVVNVKDSTLSLRVQMKGALNNNYTKFPSVSSKTNRVVAFPNTYEHKVNPFGAFDKEEEGLRKIVSIGLINPLKRMVSTADVLPQRGDWRDEAKNAFGIDFSEKGGCCKMTMDNARRYYEEANEERGPNGEYFRNHPALRGKRGIRFVSNG